jgi:hypothetical protein
MEDDLCFKPVHEPTVAQLPQFESHCFRELFDPEKCLQFKNFIMEFLKVIPDHKVESFPNVYVLFLKLFVLAC